MNETSYPPLAIFAGGGDLPLSIIKHCQQQMRPFIVICFKSENYTYDFTNIPHRFFRMGEAGKYVKYIKENNIKEVIFAGGIKRPNLKMLKPDLLGIKILAKLGTMAMGDDGLLSKLGHELEKQTGAKLIGVEDIFGQLKYKKGPLGKYSANAHEDAENIRRGHNVLKILSDADIGQGVIVQAGIVIAVEAIEGTDAMILRSKNLQREGGGGILCKRMKIHQSRKADLPTIGPTTIENLHHAGLKGLAIGDDGIIIIEKEKTIALADKYKIFIEVV